MSINYSLSQTENRSMFLKGCKDGLPIAAGYFAVAFSLGIAGKALGLKPFHCMIISVLTHASAGEYATYNMMSIDATYIEMAIMILIANARYLLMSCAMSQKLHPDLSFGHRLLMGFGITDEIFGICIACPNLINPNYMYGAMITAIPAWALGSGIGCFSGNILPDRLVSALGVALFGMFLAIIIPPAKGNKIIGLLIVISFIASYITSRLDFFENISSGTITIILTVAISALAAIVFPHVEQEDEES